VSILQWNGQCRMKVETYAGYAGACRVLIMVTPPKKSVAGQFAAVKYRGFFFSRLRFEISRLRFRFLAG
jgi:hypothetical protein